jgi:hypothetical protein
MKLKEQIKLLESQIQTLVDELAKHYDDDKMTKIHMLRIKLAELSKPKRRTKEEYYLPDIKIYGTVKEDFQT